MAILHLPSGYCNNKEMVISVSRECTGSMDMYKKYPSAYSSAARHGWTNELEYKKKMNSKGIITDYKSGMGLEEISKKYHIGKAKVRKILTEHAVVIRRKGAKSCTNNKNLKWTIEACKEESLKYGSKSEFQKNNQSAYKAALRYGWLDGFYSSCENNVDIEKAKKDYQTYKDEIVSYISSNIGRDNIVIDEKRLVKWNDIGIIIPSMKIGININFNMIHCESNGFNRNHMLKQTKALNAKGYRVIQIFSDE